MVGLFLNKNEKWWTEFKENLQGTIANGKREYAQQLNIVEKRRKLEEFEKRAKLELVVHELLRTLPDFLFRQAKNNISESPFYKYGESFFIDVPTDIKSETVEYELCQALSKLDIKYSTTCIKVNQQCIGNKYEYWISIKI